MKMQNKEKERKSIKNDTKETTDGKNQIKYVITRKELVK